MAAAPACGLVRVRLDLEAHIPSPSSRTPHTPAGHAGAPSPVVAPSLTRLLWGWQDRVGAPVGVAVLTVALGSPNIGIVPAVPTCSSSYAHRVSLGFSPTLEFGYRVKCSKELAPLLCASLFTLYVR